jgi:hypothetical protein
MAVLSTNIMKPTPAIASISKAVDHVVPAQKDSEGLILASEEVEQRFVVDCPSLHIVSASDLGIGRAFHRTPVCLTKIPRIELA